MEDTLHWVWLSLCCTPGTQTFAKLWAHFGSVENIYAADADALAQAVSTRSLEFQRLKDKALDRAQALVDSCFMRDIGILPYTAPLFPPLLRTIKAPPALLYYRGTMPDLNVKLPIAVVGTRAMSDYGKRMTFTIAHDLARAGAVVVSGMALGIDSVAAAAALHGGQPTLAVLGSGVDVVYPSTHQTLYNAIVRQGAVLSEYAPGTRPFAANFPTRNRLISGMSRAVAIMEGTEKSGALITARYAKEQGKTVYALPGNVDERNSEAVSLLIKQGAKSITCADDIIEDYAEECKGRINPFKLLKGTPLYVDGVLRSMGVVARPYSSASSAAQDHEGTPVPASPPAPAELQVASPAEWQGSEEDRRQETEDKLAKLDAVTRAVYDRLPETAPVLPDALVSEATPIAAVMNALTLLEIAGLIRALPGGKVRRV